ncbi:unnamed protein product [Peronospora farinosa]|nr:unnamed protein product [Peronospora farinosa]
MLKLLHTDRYHRCVSVILDLALQRGYLVMARQFFERRNEQEKCQYVAIAVEGGHEIVLMRWLIENGTSLSVDTAINLASDLVVYKETYVEAIWWLSESDRVALIHDALENNRRKVLLWVLQNTVFEDETSWYAIRSGLKMVDNAAAHWLSKNLPNDEARSWCFPSQQKEPSAATTDRR